VAHLVNMVMNVLFNDSGSWLDFMCIAAVVEEGIRWCMVEEVLTGQN
jgi:hypothetical protein